MCIKIFLSDHARTLIHIHDCFCAFIHFPMYCIMHFSHHLLSPAMLLAAGNTKGHLQILGSLINSQMGSLINVQALMSYLFNPCSLMYLQEKRSGACVQCWYYTESSHEVHLLIKLSVRGNPSFFLVIFSLSKCSSNFST